MARKWLRFPLRSSDQQRVTAGTTKVLDGGSSRPDFLRLEFTISDPAQGAPRLMPFFPGMLSFLADPQAPGTLPTPAGTFSWTQAEYDGWRTVGTLVVELHPLLVKTIAALPGIPEPTPALVWYWPVRATRTFLHNSIRTKLLKPEPVRKPTGGSIPVADPKWAQHAVSGFLQGTHRIELSRPSNEADDDAAKFDFPSVEMATDGTVGLWVAIAAGTKVEDGTKPSDVAASTPFFDPAHAANALLHSGSTLTQLRVEMLDGQAADPVAEAALAAWPTRPRYFSISFSLPGNADERYLYGAFPGETIKVTEGTTVLQHRRLPTSGIVTVTQKPAAPPPVPPSVVAELVPGVLRITETSGSRAGLQPNQVAFDFSTLAGSARASLQPPGPNVASASERSAYSQRLAKLCHLLGRSPKTADAVGRTLAEYEGTIRPTTWTASDPVFRGTRRPWAGVGESDLVALFDGLQRLGPSGANLPPVRPGEAMVLFLMEGRERFREEKLLAPGAPTPFRPLSELIGEAFSAAALSAASEGQIRTVVRSSLLWTFFGLDEYTLTEFSAASQDEVLKFQPPIAQSAADHDQELGTGLQQLVNVGLNAPTGALLNGTIDLRKRTEWEFSLKSNYLEITLWLQYAEYLRRLVACTDATQTTPHPAMPASAWAFPAFSYVAFNSSAKARRAAELWQRAGTVLAGAPASWVKTPEDALRSWRLEPAEEAGTPRGGTRRSLIARVNGLHFGALARSYAAVFPRALYP